MSSDVAPIVSAQSIGPHRCVIEGSVLFWQPYGEVLVEHSQVLAALVQSTYQRSGYILLLVNAQQAKPLGAAARRIAVDTFRPLVGKLALAVFGSTLVVRAAAFLMFNAARLLSGLDLHFKFTNTEAEGRAFLDEQRRRLQAEKTHPQATSGLDS